MDRLWCLVLHQLNFRHPTTTTHAVPSTGWVTGWLTWCCFPLTKHPPKHSPRRTFPPSQGSYHLPTFGTSTFAPPPHHLHTAQKRPGPGCLACLRSIRRGPEDRNDVNCVSWGIRDVWLLWSRTCSQTCTSSHVKHTSSHAPVSWFVSAHLKIPPSTPPEIASAVQMMFASRCGTT